MENPTDKPKTVICIGDVHGHSTKLLNLWSNLQSQINPQSFNTATVIFLGDYCDRGPHTRQVLDFLTSLPKQHPNQKHIFLAGNHDFGFAGFVGALPGEFEAKDTWREHAENEENEGWFKGEGYEKIHLQGRIWGGLMKAKFDDKGVEFMGSSYDAAPAFESYGLSHGSADLVKVVPEEHKKFLADMVWVHEEDDVCIETEGGLKHYKLIAVHAGLEREKNVQEQLEFLRARDCRLPKIKPLSGRKDVWDIPEELTDTIVVSGHHGKLHMEGLRLIIDEGGGLESNPMAAIVLPSMKLIRDTDHSS